MPSPQGPSTFRCQPIFRELSFQDPFEAYKKLRSENSLLFESLKGPEQISRYAFIGIEPYLIFKVKDGLVEVNVRGRKTVSFKKPLQCLRELVNAVSQEPIDGLPPFQGGAAGMLSYDFVRYFEHLPSKAEDDLFIPDAHFFMFDRIISFDLKTEQCWIIVCPGARETVPGFSESSKHQEEFHEDAQQQIERIAVLLDRGSEAAPRDSGGKIVSVCAETDMAQYMAMVRRAKEYIAAGDIFQANLSLRLSADIGDADPLVVYEILRDVNPSPFAAYLDFGDYQIVSSSPERLVRVKSRAVDTRPIAGTRPRGKDLQGDDEMKTELLLNEKERAEHIMLIDLERNDMGKVCDYGSVHVDELMITEQYSHVIHIVSNIRGALAVGKDCFDVIRATFPGGTITGVPKVRCMEIIDELEQRRRGPYTGSIGYIGFNGDMDLNIIIRTFLVKEGKAYVQAGAGIVADSDPEREYYESLKKAEALINTLKKL
ncbi:MAG: anthranilate synthase component I family protein [Nitrospirae bacterium]|nr:anthranilate synthase component I family protein [Nitrospirota bacterium]